MIETTIREEDCKVLLEDLTGKIEAVDLDTKEKLIAAGMNYSELITQEERVSEEVQSIYEEMLERTKGKIAGYVAVISNTMYGMHKDHLVLVSLARAGTPAGILCRRYLKGKYGKDIPHYTISIIRDRGIDEAALNTIRREHPEGKLVFIDGWTGKGSIGNELVKAIKVYNEKYGTDIEPTLAVLADPARRSTIAGTQEDVAIANACLNSTITGLMSRTIYSTKLWREGAYHGAVRYEHLAEQDVTYDFIDKVCACFDYTNNEVSQSKVDESWSPEIIALLRREYPGMKMNKIKLSIGEASRSLIRRKPALLLIDDPANKDLEFVLHLAKGRGVPVKVGDTYGYHCIALLT